jgi:hypothetical protein
MFTDRAVAAWSGRMLVKRGELAPSTAGALFEPQPGGRIHGGWRWFGWRRALGERFGRARSRRGALGTAALGTAALGTAALGTAEGPE